MGGMAPWRERWFDLCTETYQERSRQERKFPDQRLPLAAIDAGPGITEGADRAIVEALKLGIPTAEVARDRCDRALAEGRLSWAHVIVEEVCEYVEAAALGDLAEARTEAIQCKAVFARIVHAIDSGQTGPADYLREKRPVEGGAGPLDGLWEAADKARAEIAAWPEWKRKAADAVFVTPPPARKGDVD